MAGWFVAQKFVMVIAKPIQAVLSAHGYNAQLYYTGPTDYLGLLIKVEYLHRLVLASPGGAVSGLDVRRSGTL